MLAMFDAGHDLSLGRPIAGEFVRDHHPRREALPFEQFPQQTLGGFRAAPALSGNRKHNQTAWLITSAGLAMVLLDPPQAHATSTATFVCSWDCEGCRDRF
jgi:hypothetical protein